MLLINEDGYRWMDAREQFLAFPSSRQLIPYMDRPVWLVLSIGLREQGFRFQNGLGVEGQMHEIRHAVKFSGKQKTYTSLSDHQS